MQLALKILKIVLLVLKILAYTVMGLLITYAVCFSVAASLLLFKGYQMVKKPIHP